jgi:serine/threonine protein kinase
MKRLTHLNIHTYIHTYIHLQVMKRLKHPNIVRYLGVHADDAKLYIFLELVPGGSIASMLVSYTYMKYRI